MPPKAFVSLPLGSVAETVEPMVADGTQAAPAAPAPGPAAGSGDGIERARLWLRVQVDAFRLDPIGYLQAVAWRVRGLRVRSRNRIAALAGRSPCAYAYWISAREPVLPSQPLDRPPKIVPVIDCRGGAAGLDETLASLPPESAPVIIGTRAVRAATDVSRPCELLKQLEGSVTWFCPIACGDRLAPGALAAYARAASMAAGSAIIYADDDLIDGAGLRCDPHFKPQWNPELFEWHDFLSGACIVCVRSASLADLPDNGWTEALVRQALGSGGAPIHLPHVLHHRRTRPEPAVPSAAAVAPAVDQPPVTVVIPTRNRADLLRNCIAGVVGADYPHIETVVVDNDSDDPATLAYLGELSRGGTKVIRASGPFNYSALNNLAVDESTGELLCFLNNDVEMIDSDWLSHLVRQAIRPWIGAVGARLLYADWTVQHAGVFTGIGGGAGHAHRYQRHDERGYFERSRLPQRVSAVTAACLVVSRGKFLAVGGFDEEVFPVAFNDVDLCLKLNDRGWQSFYEPRATLIHHESKSRGDDRSRINRTRFAGELAALKRRWSTDTKRDPFHHPHLSPFCEQFVIAV